MRAYLLIVVFVLHGVRLDELPEEGTGCCLQGLHGVSAKLACICITTQSFHLRHMAISLAPTLHLLSAPQVAHIDLQLCRTTR